MRKSALDNPAIDFLTSDSGSNSSPLLLKELATLRLNDRLEQIRAF